MWALVVHFTVPFCPIVLLLFLLLPICFTRNIFCLFVSHLESSIAENGVHIRYLRGRHVLAHSRAQLEVIGSVITAAGGTFELLTESNYRGAIASEINLYVLLRVVSAVNDLP